ncbi:MAG: pyrroline-5-carboxylate reductase [Microbacteriaceae bacterium]|nr:pyrroline-5-carboxylate reductase [Microbacteriaceae bacterium]
MNGAILAGLTRPGAGPAEPVRVTARSEASAERLRALPRTAAAALETDPGANRAAVDGAGIVVVGTKPAMVPGVLADIADALAPGAVVISIAAGVETATMAASLPAHARIVRAMPNTPATIGLGVTGIAAGRGADAEAMALARAVFESVGSVLEVDEALIPAIGAASGSGPAHVYLLIERMIEATERVGLDADAAADLVIENFRGAVEMVRADREAGPAELRRRVTSPNGTTERSIAVLEEAGLAELFTRSLEANIARSRELAREAADPADPADPVGPAGPAAPAQR